MQCNAKYEIYDKDGNLMVTFFCTEEEGHEGPHAQLLQWNEQEQKSIMGS